MLVSTDSIVLLEPSVVTNTQHHLLAARNCKEDIYGSLLHAWFSTGRISSWCCDYWSWLSRPFHDSNCYICNLPIAKSKIRCIFQQAALCFHLLDLKFLDLCIMGCSWFAELVIYHEQFLVSYNVFLSCQGSIFDS